tara:strand:- start:186 stop:584 length:399 start_codon:yes stop_codon:yes gene_type:complete
MGVPNTSTFSLQDVVNEVNPTTDDLVDCFADAVASKFDSTYSGSKNQLLNFRNYGGTLPVNGYIIRAGSTSSLACSGASFLNIYQRSTFFNFDDPIYSNAAGTTNATSQWYSNSLLTRFWNGSAWTSTATSC